ncbi:hypothetical protein AX16_003012 [Volvariella volvacea WC 439]|nr:hypothetical protein AX16_003012 [Volvariella volvacea WC 439]
MTTDPETANAIHLSQLPVEILHQIFDQVTQYAVSTSRHGHGLKSYTHQHHLTLTSVCRSWRHIAISHAPLWTTIQLPHSNHTWISNLVLRSKGHPLSVSLVLFSSRALPQRQADSLALILPHFSRIREFDLSFYTLFEKEHAQVLRFLSQPAPALCCLRVHQQQPRPSAEPPTLFNNYAPALCHLQLVGSSLPQDSLLPFHPPQQLTSLRLIYAFIELSLAEFLSALCTLPNLTQLHIKGSIPEDWCSSNSSTLRPTVLSTLTHLVLIDNIRGCGAFLDSVLFNPEANIEISAEYEDIDGITTIIPFCKRLAGADNNRPVSCIRDLSITDYPEIECRATFTLDGRHEPGRFTLSLVLDDHPKKYIGYQFAPFAYYLVAKFLASPTIRSTTLSLVKIAESKWREIFRQMENLEALSIVLPQIRPRTCELKELISALDVPPDSLADSVALPCLKSLALPEYPLPAEFDALCDCLGRRKEKGYSLESLLFKEGDPDDSEGVDDGYYAMRYEELGLEWSCPTRVTSV